jgi:hypothetical protein
MKKKMGCPLKIRRNAHMHFGFSPRTEKEVEGSDSVWLGGVWFEPGMEEKRKSYVEEILRVRRLARQAREANSREIAEEGQ